MSDKIEWCWLAPDGILHAYHPTRNSVTACEQDWDGWTHVKNADPSSYGLCAACKDVFQDNPAAPDTDEGERQMDKPHLEIAKLKHGESWIWPESDYGKAEIWRLNDVYVLFEIPQYGGKPNYVDVYGLEKISDLVNTVLFWT